MSERDGSRIQVDSDEFNPRPLRPQPLQPQASPVNTYADPNAGQGMQQLARALSGIAPELSRFSDIQFQKEKQGAEQQATIAASKAHDQRLEYADAVKKGVIQPNENPWFQYYFKQQSGALAAGDYGAALKGEMETNPAWATSTDPNDFYKLEGQFKKQWVQQNVGDRDKDPQFAATFHKILDGVSQDAAGQFATAAGARMHLRAGDQLNQLLNQTIDRSYSTHQSRDTLVAQLNAVKSRYLVDNPNGGTIANEQVTRAIRDYALDHPEQAEEVFGLAKDIKAGSTSLEGVGIFKEMRTEARKQITTAEREKLTLQVEQENAADKKGERTLWSDLVNDLSQSKTPGTLDLSQYVSRAKAFGNSDEVVRRAYELRQSFAQKDAPGNDETYRRAMLRVYGLDHENPGAPLSMDQLAGYANMAPGLRISSSQFMELANKIQERDRAADEGRSLKQMRVLTNPSFTQAVKKLQDAIVDPALPTHMQQVRSGMALEELTTSYLEAIPQLDAAGDDLTKQQKIMDNLLHNVASAYAPDFARSNAEDTADIVRAQRQKLGVYDTVVHNIRTPDERRSMERIMSEVGDINQRPYNADKTPRTLSESTTQFLFNHGMATLYKTGQKIGLDDINDFLSEYRRANNLK